MLHVLRTAVRRGPVIAGSAALVDYLHADMAHSPTERVRVLHLNCRNMLIRDEVVSRGGVDRAAVPVRRIVARALELGASGLILVHNHPSGDPAPSREDVETTNALVAAARPLGIDVHDHVIVGAAGCASLRARGLM
jgi:DNA repair protein RadC